MMRHTILSLTLVVALCLAQFSRAGTANLVINGSFESPVVPANPGVIQTPSIPGWSGSNGIEVQANGVLGAGNVTPFGNQYAELNVQSPSTYSQTVNTSPRSQYVLSFALADRPGAGATTVRVDFSGNPTKTFHLDASNTVQFQTFSERVTAKGSQSVLSFAPQGPFPVQGQGDLLDNVSLSAPSSAAVPLPSALVVGMLGLLALLPIFIFGSGYRRPKRPGSATAFLPKFIRGQ